MRKLYLDNIRWITVTIVVLYHVLYIFNGAQTFGVIGPFHEHQLQDAFLYMVYPWFMALLFVVSGMSAKYYLENHSDKDFLKDKTYKLLVPSTIGLVVFQWTTGYMNMLIGNAFANLTAVPKPIVFVIMALSGIGPLWFIQLLWILSVILLLVRKIEKGRLVRLGAKAPVWLIILFVIIVYGSAQILNSPIVTVYRFGIYGFCFFVGYFCFSNDEVMDRISRLWIFFDIIAIGLGIAYTVLYFGENYAVEPVINNVLACTFCWFAILAILSTMKKYGDNANTFSKWMTKKSWGLYVFHYLPLSVAAYVLINFAPNMPTLLIYVLVTISAFAGAFALYEIVSRIPVIRFCILGIKEKKHV